MRSQGRFGDTKNIVVAIFQKNHERDESESERGLTNSELLSTTFLDVIEGQQWWNFAEGWGSMLLGAQPWIIMKGLRDVARYQELRVLKVVTDDAVAVALSRHQKFGENLAEICRH